MDWLGIVFGILKIIPSKKKVEAPSMVLATATR
jgi:hypothetical protein